MRETGPRASHFAALGFAITMFVSASPTLAADAYAVPASSRFGMVVAAEPHAADAGAAILEEGGNAFDAAVVVGFVLAVTFPEAGNLAGGGFCTGLRADGTSFTIDFRETAPSAATRDMFLDEGGDVVPNASLQSHLAVGVPGSVAGLLHLLETRGTVPRQRVLAPAIAFAKDGFDVPHSLTRSLEAEGPVLKAHDATRALYFPGGRALEAGTRFRQPELARTLERIAHQGVAGFSEGEVADLFVEEMKRGGGIVTREDLRDYEVIEREPFVFRVGTLEVATIPPPSSGGVVLAQILGLVDLEQLKSAGFHSAECVRLLTEAERLAYADRSRHLGDPAFADVPTKALVSPEYLAARRRLIPSAGAGKSDATGPGTPGGGEREETTHFCVADRFGNVAAITTTLNGAYGMGAVVPGAGFFLNNEMDDFSAKPGAPNLYGLVGGDANAIEPGKRMLSSMTPTIVKQDGAFFLTVGSPGGSTIPTTVLQILLNVTEFGMGIREAIDRPRVHHQWLPDEIAHEKDALPPETMRLLREAGYMLRERETIGRAMGILRGEDGVFEGAADRRSDGKASAPRR